MLNRYYDKQALESSFGGFQGSTPFMFDGSIPGQAGRVMPVRNGTVETVRNIFNASPDKVKSILKKYPVVSGAIGIASFAGLGYGAAALADRYNRDRTAGYTTGNPYIDKHAISQGMLFWKGLKRPFSTAVRGRRGKAVQRMLNQKDLVPAEGYQIRDLFNKMDEVSNKLYRVPAFDGAISKQQLNDIINRVHINKLNRVAERLASNIDKAPSYFGALKQSYQASPTAYRAGMLAVPAAAGAAGLGGIGYAVMPEEEAWYDRFAGYDQGNPYLDKIAVSQALYNSAVKKRLMSQIMGYGTNPSRTVNLPVIQNNMKNAILRNRDMSTLRAVTSGPVSGQDGYSGLFRNINIRNNAARNTANLTAEALREMPWYMRPLAMVS